MKTPLSQTGKLASEVNNDFFILEVSIDGYDFFEIERYGGAGNSNQLLNYEVIHRLEKTTTLLYLRLSQVDFDGSKETFPVIVTRNNLYKSTIQVSFNCIS